MQPGQGVRIKQSELGLHLTQRKTRKVPFLEEMQCVDPRGVLCCR